MTTGNKRLDSIYKEALKMKLGRGRYQLDAYNQKVVTNGVSVAVTTRINACSHYWILEIDETDTDQHE